MTPTRDDIEMAEQWFRNRDTFERALDAVTGYPPNTVFLDIAGVIPFEIPPNVAEKYIVGEIRRVNAEIRALGVDPGRPS